MALKFFKRRDPGVAVPPATSNISNVPVSETAISEYPDDSKYDSEKGIRDSPINDAAYTGAPRKGSRIDAPMRKGSIANTGDTSSDEEGTSMSIAAQIEAEKDNAIKYRTCSWPKTAALLFSEYICLAIMSFPYSYAYLGLVAGLFLTVIIAAIVLYTSLVLWEFCLRHPEVRDVTDIGQMLFWNYRAVWWITGVMFVLNNTFIQGFHCLVGAKYLNTVSNHGLCTIGFSAIMAVISWACSLPRTFDTLAKLATASAIFTFISVLLATIFTAVEPHPAGYPYGGTTLQINAGTPSTTTYVAGMNAFLNISYTFIGQITLPSFIAEMKEPKDFPKAVWLVTICEVILFSIVGGVIYGYTGYNYYTAPAFGSIGNRTFQLVSFSFMIPTLIFLGVLYASVSARFIFFNIFQGTKHMSSHTVVGWASWAGILAILWVFAFIIAEVIPFFSDLLALMSSLFDSFFGFIFWGTAYIRMRKADYGVGWWKAKGIRSIIGAVVNISLIVIGFYFLVAGTYASVQSIIDGYASANFAGPFSCADNGVASQYSAANPLVRADVTNVTKRWFEIARDIAKR